MSIHPLRRLSIHSGSLRRAQAEPFEFTLTTAGVRVRNLKYDTPAEHEYMVVVADGVPASCTCPADANYDGACKHRLAVAIRTPVLQAAITAALAADGGEVQSEGEPGIDGEQPRKERPPDCTCPDDPDGFPCWPCVLAGRRTVPE